MLQTQRTDTQTLLLRTDLADDALQAFRDTMRYSLEILEQKLKSGRFQVIRSRP